MPPVNPQLSGQGYWRSLRELAGTPEFRARLEKEFPPNESHDSISETTRRQFLKVMGASVALAGLTSCRWPEEKIAPFAHRPEGRVPGVPQYFATARELDGVGLGLLVTSYDGRPIKVEGNPVHPSSRGAADIWAQASLLEMYDPDRSRSVIYREGTQRVVKTWEDFDAFAKGHFATARQEKGAGLYVLWEPTSSPSVADLRERMRADLPDATWVEYEVESRDNEREGLRRVYGKGYRARIDFSRAERIVCLDADPLLMHPSAVGNAADFAARRNPAAGPMSRLYVFENSFTVTGAMADHRVPVPAIAIPSVAAHLAAEVLNRGVGTEILGRIAGLGRFFETPPEWREIFPLAVDLAGHRGACVVMAGPRQPPVVHALAALLNAALGNVGSTVTYVPEPDGDRPRQVEALRSLVEDMEKGRVKTLVIAGGNPVFTALADMDFAGALSKVPTSIHCGLYNDETGKMCAWHVPTAHYLEAWGDTRDASGTYTVAQPLIAPLYNGRSTIEVLESIMNPQPEPGYGIVRRTFRRVFGETDVETRWETALHEGLVQKSAWAAETPPPPDPGPVAALLQAVSPTPPLLRPDNLEIVFVRDRKVLDGRFANNSWLQELPDPITKVTWDNALLVSPDTLRALGLEDQDVATVSVGGREVDLPVLATPGQAPYSLTVALGYGRTAAGNVGTGVGFDTYRLRSTDALHGASGVRLKRTGRRHSLATTQDHFAIDTLGAAERARRELTLVREATLEEFQKDDRVIREEGPHVPKGTQLFTSPALEGHKWAMAIDLNVCIGCNACVTACQAENNIPVVGKTQVLRNREMHWLRVDRYFHGDPERPTSLHQPLMCVHCENAPCEQVCPVAATVHTAEGLNMMVYNRCIGTRYCSNNCPYKVRRFNFFNYFKRVPETTKLMYNPEVTIRARGVMEKCSYCLQRIEAVKIAARNERRPIRDGEIQTACQQTCPTQAIVFGDLSNPESEVVRRHDDPRAYEVLDELLTIPRTRYLGRLRNPNPLIANPSHEPNHL